MTRIVVAIVVVLLLLLYIFHNFCWYVYIKTEEMERTWKELSIKDKIGYAVAIGMISSGILMAFLSFFLNAYNIATGVLIYIAQCFVIGGGLVGANVYFKSKWIEFNTQAHDKFKQIEDEIVDRLIEYDREK